MKLSKLVWLQGTGPGGRERGVQSVAFKRRLLMPLPFEFAIDLQCLEGHDQRQYKSPVTKERAVVWFTPYILNTIVRALLSLCMRRSDASTFL